MAIADLYRDAIIAHNRSPHNFGELSDATHQARGTNAQCGDHLEIFLRVSSDGVIEQAAFSGEMCAIAMASASLLTESLKGVRVDAFADLLRQFHQLVGVEEDGCSLLQNPPSTDAIDLGEINALSGLRAYPSRIKSATLAWHAVAAALAGHSDASTESSS